MIEGIAHDPIDVLKFGFWNIQGYKSKTMGNKFVSQDFLQEIVACDVIGLAETHIHSRILDDLAIPGFSRINYKIREPHSKGNCGSGGVALFSKGHISQFLVPIQNDNEDVSWVRIKKELLRGKRDIYLATIYISPKGNKENISKTFEKLGEEIETMRSKGEVMLQGDLNARTSNKDEIIIADKYDQEFELVNSIVTHRNSEDSLVTDRRGEELLELCKALNMIITNGRKTGDLFGNFTSYNWNGKAVVDYVISSLELYHSITSFKVGKYSPFVSDHCPLLYEIHCKTPINGKREDKEKEAPDTFYIKFQDKEKLMESLKCPEIAERLTNSNSSDCDPQEMATEISNILLEACAKAQIKPKRKSNRLGTHDPWFDKECRKLKNSIKRKCRTLKRNNSNIDLHSEILSENKLLKKMLKKNKNAYKSKIVNEMSINKGDQIFFWKLLGKLENPKTNLLFQNTIPLTKWKTHFKSILNDDTREIKYPPECSDFGPMDGIITLEELSKASYILRPNKSTGSDSISNEMILCLLEVQPELLRKLFNRIFDKNAKIEQWSLTMITPIFKSGTKMEPNNYRGISLLSCLGKLFAAILNQRLLRYAVEKNILRAEQLGFIQGNRTSDAHITLNTLIQSYCHKNNKKIFACFVDFKKAFDTIPRDVLFTKLLGQGITGKFFNILKTFYTNDNCCVKLGNKITETFQANQGVKQGCILSPLLFNIFISDLVPYFNREECEPLKINNSKTLCSLIWADDLVVLSESEDGLKNMLQNLSIYADENRIKINSSKTKCMIFNKTGRFLRRSFKVGQEIIYTTNNYKYLGFIMTPSGEINTGLKDLKDRALRAYYSLKNKMGHYFMLCPSTSSHLFDSLIKPILLYNSDFWGCHKMPENNPIENVHMRFCKQLLGVQRQTTNVGVLLEMGRIPIMHYAIKNCIKNWSRIHITGKANEMVLLSHQMSLNGSLKWSEGVKSCLDRCGIGSQNTNKTIHNMIFKRMTDIFYQESFTKINSVNSKLRTFAKLKTDIGMAKYLTQIKCIQNRVALSKIRLSNHDLMIEKGRHLKIDKTERFCPFCPNIIETESHFLLECKTFSFLRRLLFAEIEIIVPIFNQICDQDKFSILLNNENIANQVGDFINKALNCRRFLLNKPKYPI